MSTSKSKETIEVIGAEENNLQALDVSIPLGCLVVVTGPSGSGKTSLVHGVIGRIARRRWDRILGLSGALAPAYGPLVRDLMGVPACIELKQEPLRGSTRSTVATYTGIAATLATMFARHGVQTSKHGDPLFELENVDFAGWARKYYHGTRVGYFTLVCRDEVVRTHHMPSDPDSSLLFRMNSEPWEAYTRRQLLHKLPARGWLAIRSEQHRATEKPTAPFVLQIGKVTVDPLLHRISLTDPRPYLRPSPRLFSPFSTAYGADVCAMCGGAGVIDSVAEASLVRDQRTALLDGGLSLPMRDGRFLYLGVLDRIIRGYLREKGLSTKATWKDLKPHQRSELLHGSDSPIPEAKGENDLMNKGKPFVGLIPLVTAKAASAVSSAAIFAGIRERTECAECGGSGLGISARNVAWYGRSFHELLTHSVDEILEWIATVPEARTALGQMQQRLEWLSRLSLGYLSLARRTSTLSGGEGQRLRLSSVLMGQAQGLALILDEPCRGLHPSDISGILDALKTTAGTGNSLIVVEHNEALIGAADHVISLGPGGGSRGGRLVDVFTSDAATGATNIADSREVPLKKRSKQIEIHGLSIHNVKKAHFTVPTRSLSVVVGPAGSGKSSAILRGMLPAVKAELEGGTLPICARVRVPSEVTFAEGVDQRLITRNVRSTVATLLGLMDSLRDHFSRTDAAMSVGLKATDFSFNTTDGACPSCRGVGRLLASDTEPTDEVCHLCRGFRLKPEALSVESAGMSVSALLALSIDDLRPLEHPAFGRNGASTLSLLISLGLGHLQLARSLDTLSGGERKRLGIARFQIQRIRDRRRGLIVLDEPSAGLHPTDIERLYRVLSDLARTDGHTVVVIEHQAAAIAYADHIVDIGPAAGSAGGRILFCGDRDDFWNSDSPSARAFRTGTSPRFTLEGAAAPKSPAAQTPNPEGAGEGIAHLSNGTDLDGTWEHSQQIRPRVKIGARSASQKARVWELLDLCPWLLKDAEAWTPGDLVAVRDEEQLKAILSRGLCGFSPVARQLRMYGPAISDLRPATTALLRLGYREAVVDQQRLQLKDLPKVVKGREELRRCLVLHPQHATGLIDTSIRWSAGVVSRLGKSNEVLSTLSLRHIGEDGLIGGVFDNPQVSDGRSPTGRCESCAGTGTLRTYDLSLIIRKHSASITEKNFLVTELADSMRGLMAREVIPAARAFSREGVADLLSPPEKLQQADRLAFEFGFERRLLKASAKRSDREADWHRWRGIHDYVYQSWSRIPNEHRANLRASFREDPCPACKGTGLSWESDRVIVAGRSIRDWWSRGTIEQLSSALPRHEVLRLAASSGLSHLRLGARLAEVTDSESVRLQLVSASAGPLRGVELVVENLANTNELARAFAARSMLLSATRATDDAA